MASSREEFIKTLQLWESQHDLVEMAEPGRHRHLELVEYGKLYRKLIELYDSREQI